MLELDADKRPTATEALAHPYLAQYADPSDEPTAEAYDESFEDKDFSVAEWRSKFTYFLFYFSLPCVFYMLYKLITLNPLSYLFKCLISSGLRIKAYVSYH